MNHTQVFSTLSLAFLLWCVSSTLSISRTSGDEVFVQEDIIFGGAFSAPGFSSIISKDVSMAFTLDDCIAEMQAKTAVSGAAKECILPAGDHVLSGAYLFNAGTIRIRGASKATTNILMENTHVPVFNGETGVMELALSHLYFESVSIHVISMGSAGYPFSLKDGASISFEDCLIDFSERTVGIIAEASRFSILNSELFNTTSYCIMGFVNSQGIIDNSNIHDVYRALQLISGSSAKVEKCVISAVERPFYLETGNVRLSECTITSEMGSYLYPHSGSNMIIRRSDIPRIFGFSSHVLLYDVRINTTATDGIRMTAGSSLYLATVTITAADSCMFIRSSSALVKTSVNFNCPIAVSAQHGSFVESSSTIGNFTGDATCGCYSTKPTASCPAFPV